ncbi:MAG: Stk1 family PASTA domain-containing Ser/Thr kinase [Chloroflexia bacterium]|nr:Stk1 family PASTA domain-containing Ser/Thr kinase [Chloroflexia bacterium]
MDGQVLGNRYELESVAGQGGMALVYRARDRILGRPVAIKVLRPEYSSSETFVKRFQREARAAANLTHPNIVSVYDVGQEGDQHYFVMEYIQGPTLKQVIRDRAPLPVDMALRIAESVCAALEYAHRQGIIHRDIKPQNILLREDADVVKVTDFGIAQSILDPETTAERLAMGTVKYISPEQARGVDVHPQSDLYSLGVVLYEMLTGRQPFEGDSPVSIALQHVEAEPLPPRRLNPALPPNVEGIVLRALAKDPRARFDSARDMRMALEYYRLAGSEMTGLIPQPGAVSPRPAPARVQAPAAVPRRVPPPEQKRRGLNYPLVFVLLLVIAGGIYGLTRLVPQIWPSNGNGNGPTQPTPQPTATVEPTAPPELPVPDLTGMLPAEARAKLEEMGFIYQEGKARFDPYSEPGHVVDQDPPYGEYMPQGTVVTVTLCSEPGLARIPRVVDMSFAGARLTLEQAGFRVQKEGVGCAGEPLDQVVRQEPRGGIQEIQGITITLYVSIGEEAVLPELLRVPLSQAQQRAQEAGLSWGYPNPQTQEDMPPGVDIDDLGAPGQVISFVIEYDGQRRTSGELQPGDRVPCGAWVYAAYYATKP